MLFVFINAPGLLSERQGKYAALCAFIQGLQLSLYVLAVPYVSLTTCSITTCSHCFILQQLMAIMTATWTLADFQRSIAGVKIDRQGKTWLRLRRGKYYKLNELHFGLFEIVFVVTPTDDMFC